MQVKTALLDALPCLLDLAEQAGSEAEDGRFRGDDQECFSLEYLLAVQQDVMEVIGGEITEVQPANPVALKTTVIHPHLFLRYMLEQGHREAIADVAEQVTVSDLLQCDPVVAR